VKKRGKDKGEPAREEKGLQKVGTYYFIKRKGELFRETAVRMLEVVQGQREGRLYDTQEFAGRYRCKVGGELALSTPLGDGVSRRFDYYFRTPRS